MLPRPDEEVVNQGLGFDVATLIGRRRGAGSGRWRYARHDRSESHVGVLATAPVYFSSAVAGR